MKVKLLISMVGREVLSAGQIIDVPESDAISLRDAGMCEFVDELPAAETPTAAEPTAEETASETETSGEEAGSEPKAKRKKLG